MNNINLSELGNVDYIPKDRSLCENCINWDICPYTYVCPSLDRLIKFEEENQEL